MQRVALMRNKSFVGFGFGPIQAGLFVFEAIRSGNFNNYVIAEIDSDIVQAVRQAGGFYEVNVAHENSITTVRLGPVLLLNPTVEADRVRLIEAIADADEFATALPSVQFYSRGNEASVSNLLAEGWRKVARRRGRIIYTAENHNHAAEILRRMVETALGNSLTSDVQFLNTVIGKMSGVIIDEMEQARLGLKRLAPGISRALLVEEFNHILISRVTVPSFRRGIELFVEKADLLPFEDAKLYGHNATHALFGYLANQQGCRYMSEVDSSLREFVRAAFLQESGAALVAQYSGLDKLFTPAGFEAYAEDLLKRMVNPWLSDAVERVIRDPRRKLGWHDRLVGTMRLALDAGIVPHRFAKGAAAAFVLLAREQPGISIEDLWPEADEPPSRKHTLKKLIEGYA
jgi:mannitol-1-phosphate 5-dehydrogenase